MTDLLGVRLRQSDGAGLRLQDLFGLALRVNPKRPQLLVSTVLGKHVPTDPWLVAAAGRLLGLRCAEALGMAGADVPDGDALTALLAQALNDSEQVPELADEVDRAAASISAADHPGLVFGYAETATGLGHLVAGVLRMQSIHSTRRRVPGYRPALGFDEAHSHAVEHLVLPDDDALLATSGPAVLVDDELSTGRTALNTIAALHEAHPRKRYLIACLLDVRRDEDRRRMAETAQRLGTRIDVVSLAAGEVEVPATDPSAIPTLAAHGRAQTNRSVEAVVHRGWPVGVRESGRHGFTVADEQRLQAAAADVAAGLDVGDRVLVLGTEELMHAPLAIAGALAGRVPEVRYSTTTRSPAQPYDDPGYAIGSAEVFTAHDRDGDDPGIAPRYAYNLRREGGWSDLVVVVDTPGWTEWFGACALPALAEVAERVQVVVLPVTTSRPAALHGAAAGESGGFGSYRPDEVTWLLKDLSDVRLEADLATREREIQAGRAHYAESLPVEYVPEPAYRELFDEQLGEVAGRVARAVGTVAELSRAVRDRDDLVLVSLARAGTPIGILMRRWAAQQGLDWPHYTISIVRDRGIDLLALRHLADRYDPERVLFVDGWTGKGAITREFAEAIAGANRSLGLGDRGIRDDLAVLADPGESVSLFGTRDDFLIPSACLNSTVSGLVSRTVLNTELIGPGDFHGAKFYAELAGEDVSGRFLDVVSAEFGAVGPDAVDDAAHLLRSDRSPTWVGWQAAERIRVEYGLPSINLVKPGVGETTRVLLRRIPWRVVINPDRRADLRHVELLASARGVPVVPVEGLPYSCIGLIRPTEQDGS